MAAGIREMQKTTPEETSFKRSRENGGYEYEWGCILLRKEETMKRIGIIAMLAGIGFAAAPAVRAQGLDHGEFGAFAEYYRIQQTQTNFGGVGGRLSANAGRYFQLEAEMGYDFTRAFNESFSTPTGFTTTTTVRRSDFRILHGLFGPKIQMGGPVKLFVTIKGGFDTFLFDPRPPGFASFASSIDNLNSTNTHGAFYPGLGAEVFLGPIGLRLDVGDEIFWANGAHNNLKISVGPTIRF
jgi:hypothetical protein